MSYQDKLKPISSSGYQSKLKPIESSTPAPEKGFLGTSKTDSLYGKVLDNSITRGIQKYVPGAKVGQAIGTLGGLGLTAGKEALGLAPKGATKAYDTSAPTPLQTIGDVAQGAATIAGFKMPAPVASTAFKTIGKAALQGGGLGALAGGGAAAENTNSESALKNAVQVAKGAAIGGATGAIASGAVSAVGQLLAKSGDKIMNSVIKPSNADIEDGFSIETVKKYDLGGPLQTTRQKTEQRMNEISRQLNTKLAENDTPIDMTDVYKRTAAKLTGNKLSNFGVGKQMAGALKNLQDEIAEISPDGLVPITDAQVVKRASGQYGAWTYGMFDPDSTARQRVYNVFYNELKKSIEDASPEGVRELNKQLSELIPVMNAVVRRIPVAERNNILSLSDVILIATSAVDPSALGALALKKGSTSGTAGKILSSLGRKVTNASTPLGALSGLGVSNLIPNSQSEEVR